MNGTNFAGGANDERGRPADARKASDARKMNVMEVTCDRV